MAFPNMASRPACSGDINGGDEEEDHDQDHDDHGHMNRGR
jgi:hypothetical protein